MTGRLTTPERACLDPDAHRELASFVRFVGVAGLPHRPTVPPEWHPYCAGTGPAPPSPWSPEFTEVE